MDNDDVAGAAPFSPPVLLLLLPAAAACCSRRLLMGCGGVATGGAAGGTVVLGTLPLPLLLPLLPVLSAVGGSAPADGRNEGREGGSWMTL